MLGVPRSRRGERPLGQGGVSRPRQKRREASQLFGHREEKVAAARWPNIIALHTVKDRAMHELLQDHRAMIDWIAAPNFPDACR
jgi:hypothetical protein